MTGSIVMNVRPGRNFHSFKAGGIPWQWSLKIRFTVADLSLQGVPNILHVRMYTSMFNLENLLPQVPK